MPTARTAALALALAACTTTDPVGPPRPDHTGDPPAALCENAMNPPRPFPLDCGGES